MDTVKSVTCLVCIFFFSTVYLYLLSCNAPNISYEGKKDFSFPSNLNDLKELAKLMRAYYEEHHYYVFILFSSAYIYKQTFMIPGSVFLNILGGALFGVSTALPLCSLLSGVGATGSYFLSKTIGKNLISYFWSRHLRTLRHKVDANKHNLFFYLLFLRLFPMTPNWLVNLMSPLVGIPLKIFFVTIILGLIPYNYTCIQAGDMIASLTTMNDVFSMKTFLKLGMMAFISLGPTIYFKRIRAQS